MSSELLNATVLITSSDPEKSGFGSGFVVRRTGDIAYIVTCAHVIRDVGANSILVNNVAGTVVVTGDHLKLDLAVLKVERFSGEATLLVCCQKSLSSNQKIKLVGHRTLDRRSKDFLTEEVNGTLISITQVTAESPYNPARAWKFNINEGDVQNGYSGSPAVNPSTKAVLGVVSHRIQEGVGIAISIEQLDRIWQPIDKHQLRDALMHLGYHEQSRAFFKMFHESRIGAYLIHGPTDKYGQQWLLNRLIRRFLPSSMTAKKFRVELGRVGRRNDVAGMWAELADELRCDWRQPPEEIAQRAMEWWLNHDIIIALYDIEFLSEEILNALVQEFWLPLANKAEGMRNEGCPHRLLMFLVDNEGVTATRSVAMTKKIDSTGANTQLTSPLIQEFSKQEIEDWVIDRYSDLPKDLIDDVEALLNKSNGGVPEWTFSEICRRCGYDWQTESHTWYSI